MVKEKTLMRWAWVRINIAITHFERDGVLTPTYMIKTDKEALAYVLAFADNAAQANVAAKLKEEIDRLRKKGHTIQAGMFMAATFYFLGDDMAHVHEYKGMPIALIPGAQYGLAFQLDLINKKKGMLVAVDGSVVDKKRQLLTLSKCDSQFMSLLNKTYEYDPSIM